MFTLEAISNGGTLPRPGIYPSTSYPLISSISISHSMDQYPGKAMVATTEDKTSLMKKMGQTVRFTGHFLY